MAVENKQRGIDYDASFGAFADNGELVGFLFCGVRNDEGNLRYYDGGTAIIPEWRGRGIGGLFWIRYYPMQNIEVLTFLSLKSFKII